MTTLLVRPGGADAAVGADGNSNTWSRLFGSFIGIIYNQNYDIEDSDGDEEVEGECGQILPDETRIWAPDLQTFCRTPGSTGRQNVGRRSALAVVAPPNIVPE